MSAFFKNVFGTSHADVVREVKVTDSLNHLISEEETVVTEQELSTEILSWGWKKVFHQTLMHYGRLILWAGVATLFACLVPILFSLIPYTTGEFPNYWRPYLYILFFSAIPTINTTFVNNLVFFAIFGQK